MENTRLAFDQNGYLLPYDIVPADWDMFVKTFENDEKGFLNYSLTMEINDELEIQIFHTLEQVKRMNEAIRRHRQTDEPNTFMIEQFQEVRKRLNTELQDLLSQATEMSWQVAA